MRLSKQSIQEIVISYKSGESQASLAKRFSIDHSTVRYHVDKYDESLLYGSGVYTLIRVNAQDACVHPSTVCSVCGKRHDTLHRDERLKIKELEQELLRYKSGGESPSV